MIKPQRGRKSLSQQQLQRSRAKILEAARTLFSNVGYKSVSMRALANASGMSPTSLYRFYPNKRAILVHIWAEVFSELFQACRKASEQQKTPQAAIEKYAVVFVEYWVNHTENYMMVYGEIDSPENGDSFFADNDIVASELLYLGELLSKSGVGASDIELRTQQLICLMHGVCHSLITIPELNWQGFEAITTGLIAGLLNSK